MYFYCDKKTEGMTVRTRMSLIKRKSSYFLLGWENLNFPASSSDTKKTFSFISSIRR